MHESSPAHGPPSGKPSGQRHLRHQTRRGTDSMNRIYRKIWSVERGVVVASELAKAKGKGKGARLLQAVLVAGAMASATAIAGDVRSEEHTSELQSLMRTSYAVFCLTKKNTHA